MPEAPEYMAERGFDTGRLTSDVILGAVDKFTAERYDLEGLVKFYYRPYLYLDADRIAAAGLDVEVVREALAEGLTGTRGIHLAVTPRGMTELPDSKLLAQIRNNYHPARAGDIYVIQEPYWFNFDTGPVVASSRLHRTLTGRPSCLDNQAASTTKSISVTPRRPKPPPSSARCSVMSAGFMPVTLAIALIESEGA